VIPTPDITLILPAYNEAATIGATILQTADYFDARGLRCEIIVAADGTDGTREIVREMARGDPRLCVIGEERRRGKGIAIRQAVALAGGAWIGYMDADNKVPIEEFGKIEPHLKAGCDLVMGSRAMPESHIERRQPWYRRLGSAGFHHLMQAVVGLPGIHDSQCGFKFFQRAVARHLFCCQRIDGYMFDVEILALAQRFGYRIVQVPIRWRDDGDSRLELVRGNLRNLIDLVRIRRHLARAERFAERAVAGS
jgi:dolichyl-phosphate beta-glucosyltransferase